MSTRLFAGTPWDRPPRCEKCGELEGTCACPQPVNASGRLPPEKQTARLAIEKRAKGKVVTVVRGLTANDSDLLDLLKRLKSACGAGGSVDGDTIEVQGRHVERVGDVLAEIGYRLKK